MWYQKMFLPVFSKNHIPLSTFQNPANQKISLSTFHIPLSETFWASQPMEYIFLQGWGMLIFLSKFTAQVDMETSRFRWLKGKKESFQAPQNILGIFNICLHSVEHCIIFGNKLRTI